MDKYSAKIGKGLYETLRDKGLTEYGSQIPQKLVMSTLKLSYPDVGTRDDFKNVDLYLLSAVDYVRNILLGNGKYLAGAGGDYRILLPSDNVRQCERYISSATKKLNRAIKLSRNTPDRQGKSELSSAHVRAIMKKDSIDNEIKGTL